MIAISILALGLCSCAHIPQKTCLDIAISEAQAYETAFSTKTRLVFGMMKDGKTRHIQCQIFERGQWRYPRPCEIETPFYFVSWQEAKARKVWLLVNHE